MDQMIDVAYQKPIAVMLVLTVIVVFLVACGVHIYKLKRMFDNDAKYEEYDNGQLKCKGYHRNIWDLSFIPALSKAFFTSDRKVIMAACLLIILLILYFYTKEQWLADLAKVNFGLVIAALVGKKSGEKTED